MTSAVTLTNSLGIAAPQFGELVRIICVINDTSNRPLIALNPLITRHPYKPRRSMIESCLSIPGFSERVKRFSEIEWEYTDENNQIVKAAAEGLKSAVIQHEIDHLNGILFIDHIDGVSRSYFNHNWKQIIYGMEEV